MEGGPYTPQLVWRETNKCGLHVPRNASTLDASIRHGVSRSILVNTCHCAITLGVADVLMSFPQSGPKHEGRETPQTCLKHAWVSIRVQIEPASRSNGFRSVHAWRERWEVGGGVCGEAYTEPASHGHSHRRHAGMRREGGGAGKP